MKIEILEQKNEADVLDAKIGTFAPSCSPTFSGPNHAIDDLSQAVVALIDRFAKSPTSWYFSSDDVKSEHLAFAFDVDNAAFFDDISSFRQNLQDGKSN